MADGIGTVTLSSNINQKLLNQTADSSNCNIARSIGSNADLVWETCT